MIEKIFEFLADNAPSWFLCILIFLAAFITYGPKFVRTLNTVKKEWHSQSEELRKENTALLKLRIEELEKQLKENEKRKA